MFAPCQFDVGDECAVAGFICTSVGETVIEHLCDKGAGELKAIMRPDGEGVIRWERCSERTAEEVSTCWKYRLALGKTELTLTG